MIFALGIGIVLYSEAHEKKKKVKASVFDFIKRSENVTDFYAYITHKLAKSSYHMHARLSVFRDYTCHRGETCNTHARRRRVISLGCSLSASRTSLFADVL